MERSAPDRVSPAPRISIIVVTYNSLTYLKELLASIGVYPPQDHYEIIVVDNASADETAQWCLYAPLEMRLVLNHENRGFAAAANFGAQLARGELLLFCNPDVRWLSPVADRLADFMDTTPACGAAAARLVYPDRSFQPSCRRFPTFTNIWFSRGSPLSRICRVAGRRFEYTLPDYDQPTPVDSASGTCLLVRKATFDKLGGFDERFFMFAEDTDLCRRLANEGSQTWFIPTATAIHHWGGSSHDLRTVSGHHIRSISRYFQKHYPRALIRNFLLRVSLAMLGMTRRRQKGRV